MMVSPTPSARERPGEVAAASGGADDDDVDRRYADADVGCEERDQFGSLMGEEEEDRTQSTSVGGGGAATKGGTTVVGGGRSAVVLNHASKSPLTVFCVSHIFFNRN